MKARLFLFSVILLCLSACIKKDDVAPYIRLNGASDTTLILNRAFVDPSAYAKDDLDGTLDVKKSGTVYSDSVGTYSLNYLAVDKSGNSSSVGRTVHVVNEATLYAANYAVALYNTKNFADSAHYSDQILSSNVYNNNIIVVDFGDVTSSRISINVADSLFVIKSQVRNDNSLPVVRRRFFGTGARIKQGFKFTYTVEVVDTSGAITYSPYTATYTK